MRALHMRSLPRAAVAALILGMCFGFAGDVQDNTAPEEQEFQLLRSLSTAIEEAWLRPDLSQETEYDERYLARLDKLAALPADEAVALVLDERLTVLEKHLVEIAMARKERPGTWEDALAYHQTLWGGPDYPSHVPHAVTPKPEHLTPGHRAAWEWMLVADQGFGSHWAMPGTAANALAKIGDPRSLDLMELEFRWVLQTGKPTTAAVWILGAFSQYREDVRPKAHISAYKCWAYAKTMAGKRMSEKYIIPEDVPDVIVVKLIWRFSAEFLSVQMEKAEPETEYAKFLGKLREEQRRIGK